MAMNPLPPQAYTKETLLRAYSWLQNQSHSIKEMATTPDILVSLYLKTTRDGDSALDRPSIQNFKNELKNLAGLMGEFEKDLRWEDAVASATTANPRPSMPSPSSMPPPPEKKAVPPPLPSFEESVTPTGEASTKELDELSQQMIHVTQVGFNLSSSTEALRLLIKLGYLKAQKILTE